ncbi:MAG: dienelactone hydrolase family protein [Solirubrobacteraceae bacterium]
MPDITADGLNAHLATPPVGEGPWPGVVVLHELFGLNDDIRSQAGRLASAGYLALAPDLYTRGGRLRCLQGTFRALMSGEGQAFADIETSRAWLEARPDCTGRVGVIGFCLGGGFALLTAARGFDASAPNYGVLPKDLDGVLSGACPMVASYGGKDRGMPGAAPKLEAALDRAGVVHDVKEYPEAGHSFFSRHSFGPFGPLIRVAGVGYHGPSAEDGWERILRFFDNQLRA